MMRQGPGSNNQALNFGKSRARMFLGSKTVVTFADVAGVEEAKQELQEVVEFLKYSRSSCPRRAHPRAAFSWSALRHRQDLMARACRGRRGRPVLQHLRLGFVEMFVGVGASRVRDLF